MSNRFRTSPPRRNARNSQDSRNIRPTLIRECGSILIFLPLLSVSPLASWVDTRKSKTRSKLPLNAINTRGRLADLAGIARPYRSPAATAPVRLVSSRIESNRIESRARSFAQLMKSRWLNAAPIPLAYSGRELARTESSSLDRGDILRFETRALAFSVHVRSHVDASS